MKINITLFKLISSKKILFSLNFFFLATFFFAQNAISIENTLTGNPKSEWDISGADDSSIQGFATQISVNAGQTIDFKIDVKSLPVNYSIKIYRLGYYNGLGARLIADLGTFSGVTQPTSLYDTTSGKTDCSNWTVSTSWNTAASVSGLYLAKLTRADTQGASHIAFVIRNDNGDSDLLFKTSDTTWQAYNAYGGNSLYVDNIGVPGFNHATKVSYNRPFNTRSGGGGGGTSEDWLFNAEYPMIRWLERNGYDVSYTTDVDMDLDPKQITPTGANNTYAHKVLLSVGHDEYWTSAERTKFENARNAGVHLAFFSGNEVYWKTRWEDNHRTLVCYKEGNSGENTCGTKCDPEPTIWTGLWRDGCDFPLADGCNPENSLTGQISWGDSTGSIIVPSTYKNLRFWRNTSIASLIDGNSVTLPYGTLGYEFDFEQYASANQKGRITMSNTILGGKNHKLSLYKYSSGAWVFGAGTVQWSWGLDEIHDRGNEAPSQDMQQATVNLFTDMSVLPETLQSGLMISNPLNITAPISVISGPTNGTTLPSNNAVIISGTASDTDGVVAGVEISIDGGTTWNVATGTNSWSYLWTPSTQGSVTIKSRAFDDNGNMETAATGITLTIDNSSVTPTANGPGGPILIIGSTSNPFSRYPIEILRAEGINQFKALDISEINATILATYEVVILGEISVNTAQVSLLTDWVSTGKTLITMKPDAALFPLLGIDATSGTLSDKYLLIDTSNGPGVGLVAETIQFHSDADLYTLSSTNTPSVIATLYDSASTATANPAVISRNVGTGKVYAFAYDLSKSVVYTRQGNPAWAGQQRDDQNDGNIRSNDLFTGTGGSPDWIDFNKIQIPQADEKQHLLSNIITQSLLPKMPLLKFWFLPRKLKAAVIMTGDDHGNNGTAGRFDYYKTFGNNTPADVLDWKAIRSTSYIFESTPLTNSAAAAYEAEGFEIALHLNSGCSIYTFSGLQNSLATQLSAFNSKYTSLSPSKTNRTHCISWSDWASKPKVEVANGIHLNTDYYYWPASWVQDRPGMFTGSGMPMRFADIDGTLLDNYQVTTQMPDESGLTMSNFINTLLVNAKGPKGYYGVFCANMHTDNNSQSNPSVIGSNAIVASAIANEIPVVSAKQMLTWLDGRNASTYSNISFDDNNLNFEITQASGAHKLQGMIPVVSSNGELLNLLNSGSPVSYTTEIIKGINYAFFDANSGTYSAEYGIDSTPPIISNVVVTPNVDGTVLITWTTDEPATSTINYGTTANNLSLNKVSTALTTNHSITITGLAQSTTFYFNIISLDAVLNSTTLPITPNTLQFATLAAPCVTDTTKAEFDLGQTTNTMVIANSGGEVSLSTIINEPFSGTTLPSGWGSFAWTGGTSSVSGGSVVVNGARLNTVTPTQTFSPGSYMEFVATFEAAPYQHIGFGGGGDSTASNGIFTGQNAWAMFSTGNQSLVLRVRSSLNGSSSSDIDLPGSLLGSPHLYRIEWETNQVNYYVDGVLAHTETITISETMRPAISDYTNDATSISVDWMKVSPYKLSGTYTSQIFDAGTLKSWQEAIWNEVIPSGTTLAVSQRQANSALAITSMPWIPIPTNGMVITGVSQFIQYKLDLSTTNANETPELLDINFLCEDPSLTAPIISTQPNLQTVCIGSDASFSAVASGNPNPTAQWQVSIGATNVWTDIPSAISDTYTFTPTLTDNDTKYRVIYTNTEGNVTSDEVLLTVNPTLTGTIGAVKNPVCPGEAIQLQLDSANGTSPYTIVVNGQTYTNVVVNVPFETISPATTSIWENTASVGANSGDAAALELGFKFNSSTSGYVTGIKFYKYAANTGAHTGNLWTASGTLLATLTFSGESASGWQEANFTTPVFIQANTTYIASYHTTTGYYAVSSSYFDGSQNATNNSLTALSYNDGGPNGVFQYGSGGVFPAGSFNNSNYWVDVLFTEANPNATYDLTSITDNDCTNTSSSPPLSSVTIQTEPIPDGTLLASETNVCEGSPVNLVFNATSGTGPFDLVINSTTYTSVTSGIPFASTTATNTAVATTIWPDTVSNLIFFNDSSVVLGLNFTSTISGTVSKIRFYQPSNSGIDYTGTLWDVTTQTALATATYTSDSNPSGWREIVFSTPVSITANTQYMASFKAPSGYYTTSSPTLVMPYISSSITAQSSHYSYSSSMVYPTNSSSANYLVDVVFTPTSSMNFNLTSITSAISCPHTVNQNATVIVGETTTWAIVGTDIFPSWDNGLPNSSKAVIFQDDYTINADFMACSIKVMNNSEVIVNAGFDVTLNGSINVETGSTFSLSNTANLLQNDSFANNSGNIIVKRDSNPLMRLDYTLWSSPVENQNLFSFSPSTLFNRFYHFNTAGGFTGEGVFESIFPQEVQATYAFEGAKGYLIRMPNNHPITPTIWHGSYNGKPNNGDISIPLALGGNQYNAVGNPYPSKVNIQTFATDNALMIEPTLYFWRKTNDPAKPSYCTFNTTSFTYGDNGEAYTETPIDVSDGNQAFFQIGQGFIVQAKPLATSLVFKNNQRSANSNNQFFRTSEQESNRFWLNMTGSEVEFSQAVIGYFTNATQGLDEYDSKYFNDGQIALMSVVDATDLVIQGRAVPFNTSDVVPLKYRVSTSGNYSIAIDHIDGLFSGGNQPIYLKDNLNATLHNLSESAYSFASANGTFDNRFEIVYQSTLSTEQPTEINNQVEVYYKDDSFVINSGNLEIKKIRVFDLRGRLIAEKDDVNALHTKINLVAAKQVFLIQITTIDNKIVVKKAMN